jgi:hypothetical protein
MLRVALFAAFLITASSIYEFKVPGLEGGRSIFPNSKEKRS